jgi:exonuclease V
VYIYPCEKDQLIEITRHPQTIIMDSIDTATHDLTSRRGNAPDLKARGAIATPTTVFPPRPDNGTMAASTAQPTNTVSENGADGEIRSVTALSDYGSDISLEDIDEDTILTDVLDVIKEDRPAEKSRVLPSIEFEEGEREDEDQDVDGFVRIHRPTVLRVGKAKRTNNESTNLQRNVQSSSLLEVEYDEKSRRSWSGTFTWQHEAEHMLGIPGLTTNSD